MDFAFALAAAFAFLLVTVQWIFRQGVELVARRSSDRFLELSGEWDSHYRPANIWAQALAERKRRRLRG